MNGEILGDIMIYNWMILDVPSGNFNIAIENGPFIDGLPIYRWFIESYGIYIYSYGHEQLYSYTRPGKRLQKTMESHIFCG